MYKVSRRDFLSLVGTASLFALIGCSNDTEKERHTMISYMALQKYELLTCEKGVMLVRYFPQARAFNVINLDNIDDSLEEILIFHSDIKEYDINMEEFFEEYSVVNNEPAIQVFSDLYGLKDYYTIDEVTEVIDQKVDSKVKKMA